MRDAVRSYWQLANGLTEVTLQRATAAARALVASGEATAEQVTGLADDLLSTSRTNRDAVLALVRYEVDRALSRMGLATVDDVAGLHHRLDALEGLLRQGRSGTTSGGSSPRKSAAQKSAPRNSAPQKSAPRNSAPQKSAPQKSAPQKSAPQKSAPQKSAPQKSAPQKSAAQKSAPQKSTAKKTTARKATARRSTGTGDSGASS